MQHWKRALGCLLIAGLPAASMAFKPNEDSLGWHGETMPQGLVKSDKEGEYLWKKDDSVMVYVPAGAFTMGSDEARNDEKPVRQVYLDAFYIDKHEVSFRQWKASGLEMPKQPFWGYVDNYPVVNVSWNDLQPYLEWSGKRLPSEAEWEKAARGTDGRTYPWGEDPPGQEHLIWKEHPLARTSTGAADCCPQGASPYGALNMAGNVYEWCQDWYSASYYSEGPNRNPLNSQPKARYRSLRGGSFVHEMKLQRTFYRYRLLPRDRTPYIGFRTAISGVSRQDAKSAK